ncbi:hypothetical protein BC936DRAFT_137279 [Jimgerdemannia flammicorona]|uniref:Uncharacterized protein n=1 Tax=Jimgerdemannia flammicorona TaxID=994334 RepID=A0A433DJH7_9FUNG|nr:hypothetical protein BC936DRAFT_137279 [Jimgerdemannia flammicorona]
MHKELLTDAQMGVDGGVTSGAGQVLVLAVRDVQVGLGIAVFLGETKIDNVDLVTAFADAHEEVVGLNVAMNEVLRMDVLNT